MAKSNILVVGLGGIGTITAYNLEAGGLATVTAVLRSNYDLVQEHGFKIWSCDHGDIPSWKPTHLSKTVPSVQDGSITPFDFVVVCTKNIPDVPPTVAEIIAPAITPGHTAIVLVQNGLNIEKPIFAAFPSNIVISGISRMSSAELSPGQIFHQDHDILIIGAFRNPNLELEHELTVAKKFADLYNASGKATGQYSEEVAFMRWRKLVYNASFNSLCAITGMDTSRLRLTGFAVTELLLPVMTEIKSIARAAGVKLAADQEDAALAGDAIDAYFRPSMQQDIEKGNFMELEIIVGEPLREAQRLGVPAPTLAFIYSLLKTLQTKTKEKRGLIVLPPMKEYGAGEMLAKFKKSSRGFVCEYDNVRIKWNMVRTVDPVHRRQIVSPRSPTEEVQLDSLTVNSSSVTPDTPHLLSSTSDDLSPTAHPTPMFEQLEDISTYTYYVDRVAGELQAQDSLDNPYRRLSVLALSFPVLLHTITSCAAEHMQLRGHCPAELAVGLYDRAIRSIRIELANRNHSCRSTSDTASSNKIGLTSDQALLAAILLQPVVIAFSGSRSSSAQFHLDIAYYILNDLDYLADLKTVASFVPKLLVQRFAIVDLGTSVHHRRRPRMTLGSWFARSSNSDALERTQPSFCDMTGCPHTVYTFLLRVMHLAADVVSSPRPKKTIYHDAISLETEMRVYDQASATSSTVGLVANKRMEGVHRAFTYAAILLLIRRVFAEPSSSPRVQHTISTMFSLIEEIPITSADESTGEESIRSGVDSASGLPFYLAAREAITTEDQAWVRRKHDTWRKVYPNPARRRLMELAENIWTERAKGGESCEQICQNLEISCDAYIF